MKIFVYFTVILFFFSLTFNNVNSANSFNKDLQTYVYICTGPLSKAYHKTQYCKGLKRCSKEILKVTLNDALTLGRKPCGFCYK